MWLLIKQHIGISREDCELVCIGQIIDVANTPDELIPKIDQLTSTRYKLVREVKTPEYPYCIEGTTELEEIDTYKVINLEEAIKNEIYIISTEGYV